MKPIDQYSDDELLTVIRQADNVGIPGSLYHKAETEWQLREQRKLLGAQNKFNKDLIEHNQKILNEQIAANGIAASGNGKLFKANIALVLVTLVAVGISYYFSNATVQEQRNIDRPYIEVDVSGLEQQLRVQYSNPSTTLEDFYASKPNLYNGSFSFAVSNVGKLPARYFVDLSQFHLRNLEIVGSSTIFSPISSQGILFPNQSTTIKYEYTGVDNWQSSLSKNQIKNTLAESSSIRIFYGYVDNSELSFETLLTEEAAEQNCDIFPTPGEQC
jgi:hypothetical protein